MNSTDINVNEELSKICLHSVDVLHIYFTSLFFCVNVNRFYEFLPSMKRAPSQGRCCIFFFFPEMKVVIFSHVRFITNLVICLCAFGG